MNRLIRALAFALFAVFLSGCVTLPGKKGKEKESTAAAVKSQPPAMKIPVGTIHHVDAEGGFVLIRSSRLLQIEPDTLITVFGNQGETTATLKVSPARKGQFLTADILSGTPLVGQQTAMDYAKPTPADPAAGGVPSQGSGSEIQVLE